MMNNILIKKRVAFVLPSMMGGGAERVNLNIMRGFVDRGYNVDLILTTDRGVLLRYVPEEVHVEFLGCARIRDTIPRLRAYVRKMTPDVMIVSLWPLTAATVIAFIGISNKPRLILSDHNHLTTQYSGDKRTWMMLRASVRYLYPRADAIVGVSNGVAEDLTEIGKLVLGRVTTIFNPIPIPTKLRWPTEETDVFWRGHDGPRIVSTGRFKAQKNHSMLLKAFAKMHSKTNAKLMLLGEGELEEKIRAEIEALNLTKAVILPGFVLDPSPYYASANVFVLASNYEGFGNVLVEAMHFGLTIVSTDCKSGPAEILANGRFGALVPVGDVNAMANALSDAVKNPANSISLQKRARSFSIENATIAYERLAFS